MRNTILKTIKFSLAAFVFTALLGNSGCLVDSGSDITEPEAITQKHLHIYEPNDEIRYDVQVDGANGTLVTRWVQPVDNVDANPLQNGDQVIEGLLQETSTLNYETSDEPVTVVRYITQDSDPDSPTYGSITVHAFNSQAGPVQHNYVHDSETLVPVTDPPSPPTPELIIPSPLLLDDNYEPIAGQQDLPVIYYVLPCDSVANTCETANQYLNESFELSTMKKETLDVSLDSFQVIKVNIDGSIGDFSGVNPSDKIRLDIRAFCGNVSSTSIRYKGSQSFYPSIGVVRYDITCNSDSGGARMYATVSRVNFSY